MDTFPAIPNLTAYARPAHRGPSLSRTLPETLPPFGDASIVRTWTPPAPSAPVATWLAGLFDGAAAWLNARADRLRTPPGPHPAPRAA